MGREVRKVPPNWEHPKQEHYPDRLQPMYDRSYADARQDWLDGLVDHKPEENDGLDYWETDGNPPDREYYRPYAGSDATWFQLWETVSEGTPVSPPFATLDELAQHLAVNGDDWDRKRGHGGWGIERAQAFVKAGWAPSLAIIDGRVLHSKDIPLDADRARGREA